MICIYIKFIKNMMVSVKEPGEIETEEKYEKLYIVL